MFALDVEDQENELSSAEEESRGRSGLSSKAATRATPCAWTRGRRARQRVSRPPIRVRRRGLRRRRDREACARVRAERSRCWRTPTRSSAGRRRTSRSASAHAWKNAVSSRLALSGGRVQPLLELLDAEDVPWDAVTAYQVDERVAPRGHEERNSRRSRGSRTRRSSPCPSRSRTGDLAAPAMPRCSPTGSTSSTSVSAPTATASLVPNCGALAVRDRDVVMSREYNGRRRMTLTIDRAREALWVVTGGAAEALAQLLSGDEEIPAARSARRCRQS